MYINIFKTTPSPHGMMTFDAMCLQKTPSVQIMQTSFMRSERYKAISGVFSNSAPINFVGMDIDQRFSRQKSIKI